MKGKVQHVALIGRTGAGTLASSVKRGFEQNGIHTTVLSADNLLRPFYQMNFRGARFMLKLLRLLFLPILEFNLIQALKSASPDMILILKNDDLHRWFYKKLKHECNGILICFHPDDPFNTGNRIRTGPSHKRAVLQITESDGWACWSPDLVKRVYQLGVKNGLYIPFACDPELHSVPEISPQDQAIYGSDVCFIGNWDSERESLLNSIAANCETENIQLAIWGTDYWHNRCKAPLVQKAWRGRPLTGVEMAKAVQLSKINLNILRIQNYNASNMRTLEIPCAGGFMLHQNCPALPYLLEPGVDCAVFMDATDLMQKIRYYLNHPDERREIAVNGFNKAQAFTYREWANIITKWSEEIAKFGYSYTNQKNDIHRADLSGKYYCFKDYLTVHK